MRLFLPLVLLIACKPPVYDEDLDVTAIPAKPGAHAGTFALKSINAQLVSVPILGDLDGGGDNYRLVTRTWDATTKTYHQTSRLCGGTNFAVFGVVTAAPETTYRLVPESANETVTIDHEAGTYEALGHVQLWALQNLEDPINTPIAKTRDEARGAFASQIYDMDGDGFEGFTFHVKGQGDVYVFQRKTVNMRGLILGPDHAVGVTTNTNETLTLSYKGSALLNRQSEGSSRQHPDPKRSWFDEIRIADGSTCDEVLLAREDGRLPAEAPF